MSKPRKPGYEDRDYSSIKHAIRAELGVVEDPKPPVTDIKRGESARWVKGQSGNPNGKPKRVPAKGGTWSDVFESKNGIVIQKLYKLITARDTAPHVREKAISQWLDRGMGKPTQTLEIDSNVHHTTTHIDLSNLSDDALAQLEAALGDEVIDVEYEDQAALPSPEDGDA